MTVRRRSPLWRRVLRAAGQRMFHAADNNGDATFDRNGELWFLRRVLQAHASREKSRPFVVFDAGANQGLYTRVVLTESARAGCRISIHAFEPSPACTQALRTAFAGEESVRIVSTALGDVSGDATLFAGTAGSTQASLMRREVHAALGIQGDLTVPVSTLGDYLASNAIARVDLLKLDVEGSELTVLRGLGARLNPEVVPIIQFEYGGTTLDAGVTLRDLYELLVSAGYEVTKLFPSALEVRSYATWMEHYAYGNYVAIAPAWLEWL